jgi:RND family efflux transporter MFP subunit
MDEPTAEQIEVAKAQLAAAEVEVKQRERDLEKTKIKAPYDGVITHRFVGVGDRVTAMPRVEIMNIVDDRALFAEVDVPERYLHDIQLDAVAEVQAQGVPDPVQGLVQLIGGSVDLETRTFRVRVLIDNRPGRLRPGGFVHVRLPIQTADDALVVPRAAVSFSDGQPAVFVYRQDESVEQRQVELGITNKTFCEIRSGLQEGDWISVSNPALLSTGLRVRLSEPEQASGRLTQAVHRREETR